MLKLRKVAVTGGFSCGKTLFCSFMQEFGAKTVNADQIVNKLLSPDTITGKSVIRLLGQDIVVGEALNHKVIAQKVFQNHERLKKLEQLIHPPVIQEIQRQYEEENRKKEQRAQLFIAEIPLLFEISAEDSFDTTIAVTASEAACIERFGDREEYKKRMARQWTPEQKAAKADLVVDNNNSIDELRQQAKAIYDQLTN